MTTIRLSKNCILLSTYNNAFATKIIFYPKTPRQLLLSEKVYTCRKKTHTIRN